MQRLARELSGEALVTVLAPGDSNALALERNDGLTVRRFAYLWPNTRQSLAYGFGVPENLRRFPSRILQLPFFALAFMFAALRAGREADVFHANWTPTALFALPAAMVHRIPIVLTIMGSDVRDLPTWLTRFILSRVHGISAFGAEAALVADLGFTSTPLKTPVDTSLFNEMIDGSDAARRIGLDPDRPIVAFIARLYDFKDPMTLVDAIPDVLEQDPAVQFAIIGDGVLLDEVRRRVKSLGVAPNVAVPGARSDINEILAASSVFVAISPIENIWSATISEATAVGVPCVMSDAGHTSQIFTSGIDCLMIQPGDSQGLATAIMCLLADSELRGSLVKKCREVHRRHGYDAREIVDRHIETYRAAIQKRNQG